MVSSWMEVFVYGKTKHGFKVEHSRFVPFIESENALTAALASMREECPEIDWYKASDRRL